MKLNKGIVRFVAYLAAAALVVGGMRLVVLATPRHQVIQAFQNTVNSISGEAGAWNPAADACTRQTAEYIFEQFSIIGEEMDFSLADVLGETKFRIDQTSDPAENSSRTEIGIRFADCEEWGVDLYTDGSGQMIMGMPGLMETYLEMPAEDMASAFSMPYSLDSDAASSMLQDFRAGYLELMTRGLEQASFKKLGTESLSLADRTATKYQVTFDQQAIQYLGQQFSDLFTSNAVMSQYLAQIGYGTEALKDLFEEDWGSSGEEDSLTIFVYVSDGYMLEMQYEGVTEDGIEVGIATAFLGEKNVTSHMLCKMDITYEGEEVLLDMEVKNEEGVYDLSVELSFPEGGVLYAAMSGENMVSETGVSSKFSNMEFRIASDEYEFYIKGRGSSETFLAEGVTKPTGNILNTEEADYSALSDMQAELMESLLSGKYLPMDIASELFGVSAEDTTQTPNTAVTSGDEVILMDEESGFMLTIPAPEGTAVLDYTDDSMAAMFMDEETYTEYYYYMLVDRDTGEANIQEYSDLFAENADMLDWYVERQTVQFNGYDGEYIALAMTDSGYSMVQGEAYVALNEQLALAVSYVSSTPMTQEELLAAMEKAFKLDLPIREAASAGGL